MPRKWVVYAPVALILPLIAALPRPASAEFFGCDDQHKPHYVSYSARTPLSYRAGAADEHYAQAPPPRVTIHPLRHAKRYCRSWLAKEYRLSGPVIVPRMHCWWR